MVKLKNWSVCHHPADVYTPPEQRSAHLQGEVYGHPGFPDGEQIVTSRILDTNGRVVTTRSREYLLDGPPAPGYIEYLKSIGHTLNEEHPVRIYSAPSNPLAN